MQWDCLNIQKQTHKFDEVFNNKKTKIINKNELGRNLNVIEDKAQDCNAYLKIKLFLANQVMEMETKIEEKDSFIMGATIKINNLTHIIQKFRNKICSMNEKIKKLRDKNRKIKLLVNRSIDSDKSLTADKKNSNLCLKNKNHSDDFISDNSSLNYDAISCYSFEKLDKNVENNCYADNPNYLENKTNEKNENFKIQTAKYLCEIQKLEKKIKEKEINYQNRYDLLTKENSNVTQRNLYLNADIKMKNSKINKLENKNILILNELIELVHSLRTIDIRNLNRIYLKNLSLKKKEDLETLNITSCLGIKYNILSAESFLSYLINTNRNKNKDKKNIFDSLKENFPNSQKHLNLQYYQNEKNNQNLFYQGKCHLDLEEKSSEKNYFCSKNTRKNSNKNIQNIDKKIINEDNAEIKINKNYFEDLAIMDQNNKQVFINKNDKKSLYNSLFNIEESDSFSNDNTFENYLDSNYLNDNNSLFVYEHSKEITNDNYLNDLIENQNKMTSKIMKISKYEEQLNYLLEKNLNKTKLLQYSDSD